MSSTLIQHTATPNIGKVVHVFNLFSGPDYTFCVSYLDCVFTKICWSFVCKSHAEVSNFTAFAILQMICGLVRKMCKMVKVVILKVKKL